MAEICYVDCSRKYKINQGVMVGERRPSVVEDKLQWKTTFGGTQPSVEHDFWCKTTFGGRQPSVEDDLRWKTIFSGKRPSLEDGLQLEMTFAERQPSVDPCMLHSPLCGIFFYKNQ